MLTADNGTCYFFQSLFGHWLLQIIDVVVLFRRGILNIFYDVFWERLYKIVRILCTKYDTRYIDLFGDLWGVYCEYLGQYKPCYNGSCLYTLFTSSPLLIGLCGWGEELAKLCSTPPVILTPRILDSLSRDEFLPRTGAKSPSWYFFFSFKWNIYFMDNIIMTK